MVEASTGAQVRVIGVGASAGGVTALTRLFSAIPRGSGLAFVVVVHVPPDRESSLAQILAGHAALDVEVARDGAVIEPEHVYVLPAGREVEVREDRLQLLELGPDRRSHAPIDRLFESLVRARDRRAIAVVLSGTGADGARGVRLVHEAGGITVAQEPADAEHPGIPRSAIETGAVDVVLPIEALAARLVEIAASPVPPARDEHGGHDAEDALRDILALVRVRTGHDFSQYKRATLLRRVGRRMQVCRLETVAGYLQHVREHPAELGALLRDFLISVTSFFRDPEAWDALAEQVVPELFEGKDHDGCVRVWVPGCATGEEAYTLAILLAEHAARLRDPARIQIFATDIDEDALLRARTARYPETIAREVSEARLSRFFVREEGHYRVNKELREMVLFSAHNLLRDPPFSRLDLVSCRNLLIYLGREAQDRVLGILHFAIRPDGFLFLGSSESAESSPQLFRPCMPKHRVYARRVTTIAQALPSVLATASWPAPAPPPRPPGAERAMSYGELHYRLVESYAPPSLLVDDELDVVHLSEHVGRYLLPGGGEPSRQLLRLVHPALRLELRTAVYAVRQRATSIDERRVRVELDGHERIVTIRVRAVDTERVSGMMLVTFDESEPPAPPADTQEGAGSPARGDEGAAGPDAVSLEPVVRELEEDLQRAREQLRSTVEQYETSLEELKASNEELQAINEELRSATEELETSKEELQSVNEELTTLNQELKEKIDELSRANSDLQNLMTSTEIAVLFLDRELLIKRFTPRAQALFNVVPSDVGRPLSHFTHQLEYPELGDDAAAVLATLAPRERAVRSVGGARYLARLHPYRSIDDRIEGVVATFLDVTAVKAAEETLRAQETMLTLAERAAAAGIWELDVATKSLRMSEHCRGLYGLEGSSRDGGRVSFADWLHCVHELDRERVASALHAAMSGSTTRDVDVELRVLDREGGVRCLWQLGRAVRAPDGDGDARIAGIAIDVTERRRQEAELRASESRFRLALRTAPVLMLSQDRELRYTWGFAFGEQIDFVGKRDEELFPADEAARLGAIKRGVIETGAGRREEVSLTIAGEVRHYDLVVEPLRGDGTISGVIVAAVDVTSSRRAELELREADRRKDEFLATLAHELRNPLAPMTASLAIQDLAEDDLARVRAARDIMKRQVAQMTRLVEDLLDVSRITQGRIVLQRSNVDLRDVFQAAVETAQPLIDERGHALEVVLPADAAVRLDADAARMTQVIGNLLMNAARYTPHGGHVRLEGKRAGDRVVVRVRDDGVGIEPRLLRHVFEPFVQIDSGGERVEHGLGIGLALVRKLVELHGGTVEARSDGNGKGTELIVTLPAPGSSDASGVGKGSGASARLPRGRKSVLVVDDNPDVAESIAELMRVLGHDASTARDEASALSSVAARAPDLVLLDLGLPGASGFDVCRRLRAELGQSVVVVAMTGWGDARDVARARDAGFDHHLVKPVGLAAIRDLVGDARRAER